MLGSRQFLVICEMLANLGPTTCIFFLKWRMALALVAAFVPLTPAAASLLEVGGSGGVPRFHSSEQLRRYLTLHMAEIQPVNWRFEPAETGDAPASDRVKMAFQIGAVCWEAVRSFVPPYLDNKTFAVHRPITIEARLYLNGVYQTHVEETTIVEGGPDDPDLAAAVASLTQQLMSRSGTHRSINNGRPDQRQPLR
jgi:hypothetical protein